jgi:hypothetical protein
MRKTSLIKFIMLSVLLLTSAALADQPTTLCSCSGVITFSNGESLGFNNIYCYEDCIDNRIGGLITVEFKNIKRQIETYDIQIKHY